ncbi:hypothetical protein, partial [Sphingomonas sp.]|uniref:hypothetical protein n=1 Tax=Sphingomonas sp. TaxID=28214 RepID=UPI00286D34E7
STGKPNFEVPLDRHNETDVVKAVPSVDILCSRVLLNFHRVIVEDIAYDFPELLYCNFLQGDPPKAIPGG